MKLQFSYDPEVDALSIRWGETPYEESDEIEEGVILDYDAAGAVIGVEVLDASKKMETLTDAPEIRTLLPQPQKAEAA